jgi:hypothetical protein
MGGLKPPILFLQEVFIVNTADKIIMKRKSSVVKKKSRNKSIVVRKKKQTKKQKVTSRQPSSMPEGQLIKRKSDCYWKERGWRMSYLKSLFYRRKVHIGQYKTKYASFRGAFIEGNYFIFGPSQEILRGPHAACFTPVKSFLSSHKYKIHFSPKPGDLSSGIASVERTIIESLTT